MSWFSSILGAGDLVETVTGGLDNLFTSDEERLQWETKKLEIKAKLEEKLADVEEKINEHVTERHKADMQSDSALSKNIRPLALIHFLVAMDVLLVLSFIPSLTISAAIISLVETGLYMGLGFYFGGRSVEKAVKIFSANKK